MKEYKCPHCHETVPHGATVCKGCQAEIEYGTPTSIAFIIFCLSIFLGVSASSLIDGGSTLLGWIVGLFVLISLFIMSGKVFANRVKFKRVYKTNV